MPLAELLRPEKLEDVIGQGHLIEKGKPLQKIMESGEIPNMIFYGPPGVGKTTIAKMIAKYSAKQYYQLNGTSASLLDIKSIIQESDSIYASNGIILYLDEIQYFNKKQQQYLLEYIENGKITLIASTTENPYFYIYNALLSRCVVFEFKPVEINELIKGINKAYHFLEQQHHIKFNIEEGVQEYIATNASGDVRKVLNTVELTYIVSRSNEPIINIQLEAIQQFIHQNGMNFDTSGDQHYDLLSGLQKSIRGSDPDAALFYLAKLLCGGDLLSPIRRLLVIACEDIGMAYPQGISIVKDCCDSAMQLGLPEARIPLAQAVIVLATAPKSNSLYVAISKAMEDVKKGKGTRYPRCIQNIHYDTAKDKDFKEYLYPHDYPNHYIYQQYLPDDLKGVSYYHPGSNKHETQIKQYWDYIKKK